MKRTKQIIDKACTRCEARPALYSKYREHGKETGWRGVCDDCERKAKADYRLEREAEIAHLPLRAVLDRPCKKCGASPAEYQRHPGGKDHYRATCLLCLNAQTVKTRGTWGSDRQEVWKGQIRDAHNLRIIQFKVEMLARYGTSCACCGESNPVFLTLDHPENNGAAERRELKKMSGFRFYEYLKKQGWPDGYRVLCWNCNCGRQWNRANPGTCPHEEERLRLVA